MLRKPVELNHLDEPSARLDSFTFPRLPPAAAGCGLRIATRLSRPRFSCSGFALLSARHRPGARQVHRLHLRRRFRAPRLHRRLSASGPDQLPADRRRSVDRFVTILSRYREGDQQEEGDEALSVILNTMLLVLGAAILLAEIFAPVIRTFLLRDGSCRGRALHAHDAHPAARRSSSSSPAESSQPLHWFASSSPIRRSRRWFTPWGIIFGGLLFSARLASPRWPGERWPEPSPGRSWSMAMQPIAPACATRPGSTSQSGCAPGYACRFP